MECKVPLRFHSSYPPFQSLFMRSILLIIAFLCASFPGRSQCSDLVLGTLQVLAKTAPDQKQAKILNLGFDLDSETGKGATNTRHFRKCWHMNVDGGSVFRQVILWRTNVNDITFLTLDENSFIKLKNEIDERHHTGGDKAVVEGKKFRYSFDTQSVYGIKYYAVTVALKSMTWETEGADEADKN